MNNFYSTLMRYLHRKQFGFLYFLWKQRRCFEIDIFDSFATWEPPLPPPHGGYRVGHLNKSTFLAPMYDSYQVWKRNLTKHFAKILPPPLQGPKVAIPGILMSNLNLTYHLTGPRCELCREAVDYYSFCCCHDHFVCFVSLTKKGYTIKI